MQNQAMFQESLMHLLRSTLTWTTQHCGTQLNALIFADLNADGTDFSNKNALQCSLCEQLYIYLADPASDEPIHQYNRNNGLWQVST